MKKTIPVSDLDRWKKNYSNQTSLPLGETRRASISLDLLQQFIDEAKINSPGFNGVRIYFIRYDKANDQLKSKSEYGSPATEATYKYVGEINDSSLSQVSLALVPVKNFDPNTLLGDDVVQPGDTIHTLAICHPTDWPQPPTTTTTGTTLTATYETGTGLCPPKGNCT